MSVEEQMVLLGKLAQEDIRLIELAGVLQQGPKELGQQRKVLEEAQAELEKTLELQSQAEAARAECEAEMATTIRRLEQALENSKRITTVEQAKASKVEIAALEKRKADGEATILKNMEAGAQHKKGIPQLKKTVTAAKKAVAALEKQVPELVEEAKSEARVRMVTRNELVVGLETVVKRMYDIASSRGSGSPLTTVIDKVCQTCHNTVPPQYLVETIQQKTIHQCTRCRKIIGKVVDTD